MTSNPTPEQVRAARESAGLTQTKAGELIFGTRRTWADWEGGARKMPPAAWHLFLLFTDRHPSAKLSPRIGASLPLAIATEIPIESTHT